MDAVFRYVQIQWLTGRFFAVKLSNAVRLTLIFWTLNVGMSLTTGYASTSYLSKPLRHTHTHIDMVNSACLTHVRTWVPSC